MSNWVNKGLEDVWLPYTQMQIAPDTLPVVSAKDVTITLEDGTELIDSFSSWWSTCHGYQNEHIVNAIKEQSSELCHVMFAGLANKQAYKLANRLVKITPDKLQKVFFAESGSVAVEIAMKMAAQYWYNKNNTHKHKFISFYNAYHGDTMGAMSLADPEDGMHRAFNKFMPRQYIMKIPSDEYDFSEFEETVKAIHHTVAGMIIEPLVQCAGGFKIYSADILAEIFRICKKYDILFIADEIATGFGRTGNMFACNEASIEPDIMCLGKSLTGGHIALAATLASDEIFDTFLSDNLYNAFMHGPTFMGNPLACAAANASLDLFENNDIIKEVDNIELYLTESFQQFKKFRIVKDIRVKGAIGVIELDESIGWYEIFRMRQLFIQNGVWLRPFGNLIYIMPSFTINNSGLDLIIKSIDKILTTFSR